MSVSPRKRSAHQRNGFYVPKQLDDRSVEMQALLEEARAGSADAHAELLTHFYGAKMLRYFSQRLSAAHRCKAGEEDLAQIARMRALDKFAGFKGETLASYWPWLRQICYRLVQRRLRFFTQAKRDLSREELLDELRFEDGSQHPYSHCRQSAAQIVEALETVAQLQAALAQLPEKEQRVVRLHISDGLSFRQVAGHMDLSVDAVKRLYKRVTARLRRRFAALAIV